MVHCTTPTSLFRITSGYDATKYNDLRVFSRSLSLANTELKAQEKMERNIREIVDEISIKSQPWTSNIRPRRSKQRTPSTTSRKRITERLND
jgi:hypothetical protein